MASSEFLFSITADITAKVPAPTALSTACCGSAFPGPARAAASRCCSQQAALLLVREMPVLAAARIMEITDQRLWRIVMHYVGQAVARLDLTRVTAIGLDETAAKRGHTYVTVFIDLDRIDEAGGVSSTPNAARTLLRSSRHSLAHAWRLTRSHCSRWSATSVVCSIACHWPEASQQCLAIHCGLVPCSCSSSSRRSTRSAVRKPGTASLQGAPLRHPEARDGRLTEAQAAALAELKASDLFTVIALAHQGKAALEFGKRNPFRLLAWRIDQTSCADASEILDPVSDPRSDPQSPLLAHRLRDSQQADPAALDVIIQECPSERAQCLFQAEGRARGYRMLQPSRP